MSSENNTVVNLVALVGAPKPQTVAKRVDRRLEVLREWLAVGIPTGKVIPSSLNLARLWEDDELSIQPIRSPNEFTTTHPEHGRSVREIAGLLASLRSRYGRPCKVKARPSQAAKFDRDVFDRALEAAASQWHAERAHRLKEKARAEAAESRSIMLLDENAAKDRLIADLRRQLSTRKGLRVV